MKIRAHETFSIRKGWIHKGVKNILLYPRLFTDKNINPCDVLGIGTNMVKSLRYWMTAVGIMEEVSEGNQKVQKLTRLGEIIDKYDRYYEEDGTNWLLHYMLAKNEELATAWYWFFNVFKINSFDKPLFIRELAEFLHTEYDYDSSEKMLGDEFDCLIKTYCSKGKDISPEDINECPLTDLHLIEMSDNKDYKKHTPDRDAIHPLIILAVISEQAKIAESREILITDLLNKECNIGKIFNLDRATCFFYLEQLQKNGYLEIVRTAGLDVIQLKQQYNFFEIVESYYEAINGVTAHEFLQDTMMMDRKDGIPTILLGFFNTLWITLIPLVCSLLQSLLVAYCYSKYRFPCKNFLFMLTVSLMFVPLGSFGFVTYMFYQNIGWTEGYAAWLPLVIPGLFASAGTVFFLRPYVDGIGKEIIEAAEIDGMGFWQIFIKVVLPLSKPALIAQFIFGFVGGYNNYAGALMYLNTAPSEMWTLQIALNKIIAEMTLTSCDFNFTCAVALMAMVPLIILYLACQKFFIEGITFGGGKE